MEDLKKSFVGKWESLTNEVRPNPWGGQYFLKRYFNNTEKEAHATLVFYKDNTYTDLNIVVEVIGPYYFLRPSKVVEGATETDFEFTSIAVTPHSAEMVSMLNSMPASYLQLWKAGVRQVVNEPGQGLMGMVIGQYKEYDLVKVVANKLYYGERPADGSAPDKEEKRASALQVPLQKVNEFSKKF